MQLLWKKRRMDLMDTAANIALSLKTFLLHEEIMRPLRRFLVTFIITHHFAVLKSFVTFQNVIDYLLSMANRTCLRSQLPT